jgi:hypothetical protein
MLQVLFHLVGLELILKKITLLFLSSIFFDNLLVNTMTARSKIIQHQHLKPNKSKKTKLWNSSSIYCFARCKQVSFFVHWFILLGNKHCVSYTSPILSNYCEIISPAICYKLSTNGDLKMRKCPQKCRIKETNNATE